MQARSLSTGLGTAEWEAARRTEIGGSDVATKSLPLGLTRTAGHVYSWFDGSRIYASLPSVTTILKVVDKSGPLVGWAKRETAACAVRNLDMLAQMRSTGGDAAAVAWLKAIPDFQRDSAADIGTRIHRLAEQIARGGEPDVSPDEAPYVAAYRDFLARFRPQFLAVEEQVANLRWAYAGTMDAIVRMDDATWLLDLKTSTGVYAETALQLAAYGAAEFIGRPGIARRFRLPRATRFGVVHVRPEGARLVEFKVDLNTFKAFLDARRLYEWRTGPAKSVIGATVAARNGGAAA